MSPSASRSPRVPPEGEIRAIVERVLDGVLTTAAETVAEAESVADAAATVVADPITSPVLEGGVRIAVGADHGGYPLKERLAFRLREAGYDVMDCGTDSPESTDYPIHAHAVARSVAGGEATWGIIVDGAGIGSAMVANKVPGVRAALCYDISTARNSREHNHANVLTLGAGLVGDGLAWQIVQEWLAVEWAGGRHARRVAMIDDIEAGYLRTEM